MTGTPLRLLLIGNSGSGKSTLAARVGMGLDIPTHDLDLVFWLRDGRSRPEDEARALVAHLAAGERWVIESVYPWLIEVALVRATALVWLDLTWDACRDGLLERGPHHGLDPIDPDAMLAWAGAHRDRQPEHARLYDAFGGHKVHLQTRREVAAFPVDRLA